MKPHICILSNTHNLQNFSCGILPDDKKLNGFLKEKALSQQSDFIGTTLLLLDSDDNNYIIGFMTLSADRVIAEKQHKEGILTILRKKHGYGYFPALKIGRLAIATRYQKQGYGTKLFNIAIAKAYRANEEFGIGIRFIVVNTKKNAKSWYIDELDFIEYDKKDTDFLFYDIKGWRDGE